MSDSSIIVCEGLGKTFFDGENTISVLQAISLQIQQGEQLAIMGRSGSGKTTLLQILGGLDAPSVGSLKISGQNFFSLSERQQATLRNQTLGFVYQFHHLLPEFTALENVAMPLLIAKKSTQQARSEASQMLKRVGLSNRMTHRPAELSGGERQRVAIARAMVHRPRCILADEPTGNLDDETAESIFELLKQLNREQGTSWVIVTHDLGLAKRLDRTLLLQNGQLVSG